MGTIFDESRPSIVILKISGTAPQLVQISKHTGNLSGHFNMDIVFNISRNEKKIWDTFLYRPTPSNKTF